MIAAEQLDALLPARGRPSTLHSACYWAAPMEQAARSRSMALVRAG